MRQNPIGDYINVDEEGGYLTDPRNRTLGDGNEMGTLNQS